MEREQKRLLFASGSTDANRPKSKTWRIFLEARFTFDHLVLFGLLRCARRRTRSDPPYQVEII